MTETPPVRETTPSRVPGPAARRAEPSMPSHLARVALGAAAVTAAVLGGAVGGGLVPLAVPGGAALAFGAVPDLPPPAGRTATDVVHEETRDPIADLDEATTRPAPQNPEPTSLRQAAPVATPGPAPVRAPVVPPAAAPRLPVAAPPARPAPSAPVDTPVDTPERPTPTEGTGTPSSTPRTPPTSSDPPRGGGRAGGGRAGGGQDGGARDDGSRGRQPGTGRSTGGADAPTSSPGGTPDVAGQRRISASG